MKAIKNFLFFSCKKASEMIEKSKIETLSPLEKSRLKIHLSMCKSCQEYESASDRMDQHWNNIRSHADSDTAEKKKKLIDLLTGKNT